MTGSLPTPISSEGSGQRLLGQPQRLFNVLLTATNVKGAPVGSGHAAATVAASSRVTPMTV